MKNLKYDSNTIYFTIGRNAKRLYDAMPETKYDNNIKKIEYFANQLELSVSYIYHLFSGKQNGQQPSFMTIINICNVLDVSIEELLKPLSDEEYEEFYSSIKTTKKEH